MQPSPSSQARCPQPPQPWQRHEALLWHLPHSVAFVPAATGGSHKSPVPASPAAGLGAASSKAHRGHPRESISQSLARINSLLQGAEARFRWYVSDTEQIINNVTLAPAKYLKAKERRTIFVTEGHTYHFCWFSSAGCRPGLAPLEHRALPPATPQDPAPGHYSHVPPKPSPRHGAFHATGPEGTSHLGRALIAPASPSCSHQPIPGPEAAGHSPSPTLRPPPQTHRLPTRIKSPAPE